MTDPPRGSGPPDAPPAAGKEAQFLRSVWDENAQHDAFFSVLGGDSLPGKKWAPDEFYATGRAEIDQLIRRLERDRLPITFERVLDFGCGLGRLSEALGDHARSVVGVDVSPEMVRRARAQSTHSNVQYVVNPNPDLRLFPDESFDLCVSHLVLQHVGHQLALRYLGEMCRVIAPRGIGEVEVPVGFGSVRGIAAAVLPNPILRVYMERRYGVFYTTTFPIRPAKLLHLLEGGGSRVVESEGRSVNSSSRIRSYLFVKTGPAMKAAGG